MKEHLNKYRWRARGLVIEKQLCLGQHLSGYGSTKEKAEANFKQKTAGFYSADADRLDFRDFGPLK